MLLANGEWARRQLLRLVRHEELFSIVQKLVRSVTQVVIHSPVYRNKSISQNVFFFEHQKMGTVLNPPILHVKYHHHNPSENY